MSRQAIHRPAARRGLGGRAAGALAACLVLAGCTQEFSNEGLLIPINPLCTVCDDFIRCEAEPAGSGTTLYHLDHKSFLAQVLTIFEYPLRPFRQRTEDERPLKIYPPGAKAPEQPAGAVALTDLVAHRIAVPGGWIDQATGAWHNEDGSLKGACTLLPVAEGRQFVRDLRAPPGQ